MLVKLCTIVSMKKIIFFSFFLFISKIFMSQEETKKEKFAKESYVHFKVGCVANFTNTRLFNSLNRSDEDVFTPDKNINYNPSADIEFEHRFSKHVGLNFDFGFMQTRQSYYHRYISSTNKEEGLIIGNVGHFNINPSFFIKNTTFYGGLGIYQYFYLRNTAGIREAYTIYSNIGVTQNFDVKTHTFTISANYFGLAKIYDSGFQLSLGMAL